MIINYKAKKEESIRDFLSFYHLSKSKIYKLFFEKRIMVNNNLINENYILNKDDIISISYDEKIDYIPQEYKLDIIYEDDYFLIINKPSGIIIHDNLNSLSNYVAYYYKQNNINLSIKYAHRLDKDTTGIIIFCKDLLTLSYMDYFISTHEIKRKYVAIAKGYFKNKESYIEKPISTDRHINGKMVIAKNGKYAYTSYKVLKEFNNLSLVELLLKTGRTHQIRVHLKSINHPIYGDELYGDKVNNKRLMLHSISVNFINPHTLKEMYFETKLPDDFIELIEGK